MKQRSKSWLIEEFTPKFWICLKNNYSLSTFRQDLLAGIAVGVVALPLAMAFAVAAGLPPIRGLYTAIVAGLVISLLGGSFAQIGGPTSSFVVIIYTIVMEHGYPALVLTTLLAGALLIFFALSRLGKLIKYIPYPLVVGFTSGIAVMIFSSQIKDFFGLDIQNIPLQFIPKWSAIFSSFSTWDPLTFAVALGTLTVIVLVRHYFPVFPWGFAGIAAATLFTWYFHLPVETVASRFGEIPRAMPIFSLPNFSTSLYHWRDLFPSALTIAFLASIESLLAAVIADGMTGRRHKSNCELMAVGVANIASVLFGGLPASGAVARTATNIKTGAKTPISGMIHSLTLLLIVVAFAPVASMIPLASLSAVLMMVAWTMSEVRHFRHLFKAPFCDVLILIVTFFLTVMADLTTALGVGIVISAFLFIKRVGDVSGISPLFLKKDDEIEGEEFNKELIEQSSVPQGVEIYEITGPFFFGLADSLKDVLSNLEYPPKVFILRMRKVPIIDATGLHALREFYYQCRRDKTVLILSGVNKHVFRALERFGLTELIEKEMIFSHINFALKKALEVSLARTLSKESFSKKQSGPSEITTPNE